MKKGYKKSRQAVGLTALLPLFPLRSSRRAVKQKDPAIFHFGHAAAHDAHPAHHAIHFTVQCPCGHGRFLLPY